MDKKISEVRSTTDYSIFRFDKVNRPIEKARLAVIRPSMLRTRGNLQSVIIDPKGNILEGQHRVTVCMEEELPVKYEVRKEGYTNEDLIDLNTTQNRWSITDFAHHYSMRGNPNYTKLLKYVEEYPQLSSGVLINLLSGTIRMDSSTATVRVKSSYSKGGFTIVDEPQVKRTLKRLLEIREFYKGWNRRAFIHGFHELSGHTDFDWDHFLSRLQIRHISLFDYPKGEDFLKALVEVYNYNKRTNKLVLAA